MSDIDRVLICNSLCTSVQTRCTPAVPRRTKLCRHDKSWLDAALKLRSMTYPHSRETKSPRAVRDQSSSSSESEDYQPFSFPHLRFEYPQIQVRTVQAIVLDLFGTILVRFQLNVSVSILMCRYYRTEKMPYAKHYYLGQL